MFSNKLLSFLVINWLNFLLYSTMTSATWPSAARESFQRKVKSCKGYKVTSKSVIGLNAE